MTGRLNAWLSPPRPAGTDVVDEPRERRLIKIEILVVFAITLGMSGANSLVSFLDAVMQPKALNHQSVAMHAKQANIGWLDMTAQLLDVVRLVAWAALGVYLLIRAGYALRRVGLGRMDRFDGLGGVGLAALIGLPGLAFYLVAVHLGLDVQVIPSTLGDTWWRPIVLTASAIGNAVAEEVLVVAYLVTRLRRLGVGENGSMLVSAVLRGSYHLYQGVGGFVGNLVMGLIFGRVWQRTNRLWPLIIAHAVLDTVAFVGYTLIHNWVSWLP